MSAALGVVICAMALWCFRRHSILYFGDAQAHLNISRSLFDSYTPGYDQLGTVWLPVLHLICLPFVRIDWLWANGLAGTIPVAGCFVLAGTFFYLTAKEVFESSLAGLVALACFALNPNVLYLGSIPMTEIVFLAGLAVMIFAFSRFHKTQHWGWIALGIFASWWMSLTRYDGWFLIPFEAIWFAFSEKRNRWRIFLTFAALSSLAPLYWMGHNWWETGNALDFYNGPYSPMAIQRRLSYPGFHDWALATKYYATAGQVCAGWALIVIGVAGVLLTLKNRGASFVAFLTLTPLFYIWSLHSSYSPIFLPQLPSQGYYNSRYGIAVIVLMAFAAGALVEEFPAQRRKWALLIPLIAAAPWILRPAANNWICWKESEQNSIARRAWTQQGADYLLAHYRSGVGILAPFGDLTGIFSRARIHLNEILHEGNGLKWLGSSSRPDLLHPEAMAVTQAGSPASAALHRSVADYPKGARYDVVNVVRVSGAPDVEIWRRRNEAVRETDPGSAQ